jgi:radical SAM superfamily enzyme YgiQ (UPF0313 family)
VDWIEGNDDLGRIPEPCFVLPADASDTVRPSRFAEDLDALPPAYLAQSLCDPRWYDPSGKENAPGGILTGRGCPAHCAFCANHVTGRSFRFRSPEHVTAELNAWHDRCGLTYFPVWDDAFTANTARLAGLCEAIERKVRFPFSFGAITRTKYGDARYAADDATRRPGPCEFRSRER